MRFILEGEWTGYTSHQRRVCHREILTKKQADAMRHLRAIRYTDGTSLILHLREAKPREKIEPLAYYKSLIRGAAVLGKSLVCVADMKDDDAAPVAVVQV